MDLTIALLQTAAHLALALALVLPAARRTAVAVLATALLATLGHGLFGHSDPDGTRTLTTLHHFAGFEGAEMEVSMVGFPTGTMTAPAWQWPLPFVAYAGFWALVLLALRQRPVRSPWLLPLLMAWTALAAWLGMQALAAPSAVVQPIGIDRCLWPAGLAMALLIATRANGLVALFLTVSASTVLARLPAAVFSKLASDNRWGTSLDVTDVRDIVNPMTQLQFDPRIAAGSGEQQFWLIWLEHVIFFPAVYLLSLFGIAFCAHMFHKHGPATDQGGANA
jgi:hypothetical protein